MLLTVGNFRYIADELLKGRSSTVADIFSLRICLLELACDMELPSGGEGWHSLRNGELPKDFVKGNLHIHVILHARHLRGEHLVTIASPWAEEM